MCANTGSNAVNQEEFIRLYVNHRPVVPLEKHLIQAAIEAIADRVMADGERSIPWEHLMSVLTSHGEKIDPNDLETYLGALTGEGISGINPNQFIDSRAFATNILGFEMS